MNKTFNIAPAKMPPYSTIRKVIMGVNWEKLLAISQSES
ncbi:hypothetical protein PLAN_70420 [Planktothrix rubescens CCAP 1459/22]|uniref:Uncharacterized protein n=1 Tax=Planktothrix rubescens CCAP 1459/22 TaxID=329571 RepID=A0A6J7ZTW6_PLARU|nr:hypothetical protein PLAN_70420 [Planktothrix rubescens NIVA-CYA 18]